MGIDENKLVLPGISDQLLFHEKLLKCPHDIQHAHYVNTVTIIAIDTFAIQAMSRMFECEQVSIIPWLRWRE
jgi:hypothetical protein